MFPDWAQRLVFLYWRLRMCRGMSRPSSRTWHRRISAEKLRLVAAGVDPFQLHAVCVLLRRGEHSPAGRRAFRLLHGRGADRKVRKRRELNRDAEGWTRI